VDPGPFFYIAITIYLLLVLFTLLQTTIFYHSISLILCLQQTGEIDNLTVSWDKVLGCVVCRFHVDAGAKLRTRQGATYKLSGAVAKLASINLLKLGSFSYWFNKPWFHTEGRLADVLITPSLGVSNWAVIYKTPTSTLHHHRLAPTSFNIGFGRATTHVYLCSLFLLLGKSPRARLVFCIPFK
jgi:hypothetical protein